MKTVSADMSMYYCPICSRVYLLAQGQNYLCTRHGIEEARGLWVRIDNHDDEYNCQKPWPIPEWSDLTMPSGDSEDHSSKLASCWNSDHLTGEGDLDTENLKHVARA